MKQRKIAISLAVVGAIAAPFVFHTYKARPMTQVWTPLDDRLLKEYYGAIVAKTDNCQTLENVKVGGADVHESLCLSAQKALEEGGYYVTGRSTPLYLALNAAVAAVAFAVVFGLTYLLPALARRYWRWLNT